LHDSSFLTRSNTCGAHHPHRFAEDWHARVLADVPIQNPRSIRIADEVAVIRNELSHRATAASG
jgi:hypothetical protein